MNKISSSHELRACLRRIHTSCKVLLKLLTERTVNGVFSAKISSIATKKITRYRRDRVRLELCLEEKTIHETPLEIIKSLISIGNMLMIASASGKQYLSNDKMVEINKKLIKSDVLLKNMTFPRVFSSGIRSKSPIISHEILCKNIKRSVDQLKVFVTIAKTHRLKIGFYEKKLEKSAEIFINYWNNSRNNRIKKINEEFDLETLRKQWLYQKAILDRYFAENIEKINQTNQTPMLEIPEIGTILLKIIDNPLSQTNLQDLRDVIIKLRDAIVKISMRFHRLFSENEVDNNDGSVEKKEIKNDANVKEKEEKAKKTEKLKEETSENAPAKIKQVFPYPRKGPLVINKIYDSKTLELHIERMLKTATVFSKVAKQRLENARCLYDETVDIWHTQREIIEDFMENNEEIIKKHGFDCLSETVYIGNQLLLIAKNPFDKKKLEKLPELKKVLTDIYTKVAQLHFGVLFPGEVEEKRIARAVELWLKKNNNFDDVKVSSEISHVRMFNTDLIENVV